jgi:arylsulfatase
LVVRWPAELRNHGEMTNHVGHVIDFMPTLLEVAATPYPHEIDERNLLPLDGKSLLPLIRGDESEEHESLCWSVPRHHAIRMERWKAIRPRTGGPWQLFDLQNDGTETTDLAKQEPERVKAMARQFEEWQKSVGEK